LDQVCPSADQYISPNQSARRGRTYQYQAAFEERYTEVVHFWDTVDRTLILDILQHILSSSPCAMLLYFLSDIQLSVKFGTTTSVPFPTTYGIPQGDALSAILFAAYIEKPLRHIYRDGQTFLAQNPENTFITTTDGCDFISTDPYTLYLPTSYLEISLSIKTGLIQLHV